ncbi:hypothetical protein BDB01DRAFT_854557 [Pilobolus umbonatus]|nr:hypothetical protein BDB01DRAFT_854557 [Pilobolus umbonatus]
MVFGWLRTAFHFELKFKRKKKKKEKDREHASETKGTTEDTSRKKSKFNIKRKDLKCHNIDDSEWEDDICQLRDSGCVMGESRCTTEGTNNSGSTAKKGVRDPRSNANNHATMKSKLKRIRTLKRRSTLLSIRSMILMEDSGETDDEDLEECNDRTIVDDWINHNRNQ